MVENQEGENPVASEENQETGATPEPSREDAMGSLAVEKPAATRAARISENLATPAADSQMCWYVVHTYSGFENKAKLALEDRIKSLKVQQFFEEVIVPEENVIELVKGQKKTTKRRFFPGYILVKMILNNETWHVVKETPRITGFVGDKVKPVPVPESEVQKMTNRIAEGQVKPRPRISFQEGESVRVVDGPFSNFSGIIEEVNLDKGKVKVVVSIFGRSTPIELDFIQVEKV